MDIYARVEELVERSKETMDAKKLFCSKEYLAYVRRKTENVIAGTFYSLRRAGFNASQQKEDRLIHSLTVNLVHQPGDEITALASDSGPMGKKEIVINTACSFVTKQEKREEQHMAVLGLLYHEIGHALFTDYPTLRSWRLCLEEGKWFPSEPKRLNSTAGMNLPSRLQDPTFRKVFYACALSVENCVEDGFVEREVALMCPGNGKYALDVMNQVLYEGSEELKNDDPANPKEVSSGKEFSNLLRQVLLYCEFGEIKMAEDYDGVLLDAIYDCIEVIDDYRFERDPKKRHEGVNELLCIMAPYIEKVVDEQKQHQQKNRQGQQGAQGKNQSGQQGSGGSAQPGGMSNHGTNATGAVEAITQMIASVEQNIGASHKNDCSSGAVNNPSQSNNLKGAKQQSNSNGLTGSGMGGNGAGNFGASPLDAAKREVENLIDAVATSTAFASAEREREQHLNQEGQRMDCSNYGLSDSVSVSVSRAAEVDESNVSYYNKVSDEIQSTSRVLQGNLKKILKDRREGGKLKNRPFGRRFEVASVVHNDGKYFSKNKLPTKNLRLGVALLVDESGSTSGKLINAAMTASLIVEDFCRELEIPHMIYGYTSGQKSASIISYAEPNEIDGANKYRITGMKGRGGTPTAASMAYVAKRVKSLPVDVRLLIVITDGESGDNVKGPDGIPAIQRMVSQLRKENVIVVAAGIGSDRKRVESEFGENFLDISDIDLMPEQLGAIIKQHLGV